MCFKEKNLCFKAENLFYLGKKRKVKHMFILSILFDNSFLKDKRQLKIL